MPDATSIPPTAAPPQIVITEFMEASAVARLAAAFRVHHDPELHARPEALLALLPEAVALVVRNQTRVSAAVIAAAPHLKAIGRLGVGLDNIDMDAAKARRVRVFPALGANALSVAEYVVTSAMVLLRGAYFANAAMLEGRFPKTALIGRELAGKSLGLVGYGLVARETARLAKALGMVVHAHDPFVEPGDPAWEGVGNCPLDALLGTCDVVSLHLPLTPETHGLIDEDALALLKPDAVLVNAGRGGVVDEVALADALRGRRLHGAAVDVFAEEPLTARGAKVFEGCPNLILTPHVAGNTEESNRRVSGLVADRVLEALAAPAPPAR